LVTARSKEVVFLNILVGVDGSPSARKAIEQAGDLVRAQNSKLTLMSGRAALASTGSLSRFQQKMRALKVARPSPADTVDPRT